MNQQQKIHIIHGLSDSVIPISQSFELCNQVHRPNTRLIVLGGEGHEFVDRLRLMEEIGLAFRMDAEMVP